VAPLTSAAAPLAVSNQEVAMNQPARTVAALLLVLFAAAAPAAAGDWTLRLSGALVSPSESFRTGADDLSTSVAVDDGLGAAASLEYRVNRRWGVEMGVLVASLDTELTVSSPLLGRNSDSDSLSILPLTVGVDLHLTPEQRADLAVGLLAAWVQYGDLTFDFPDIGLTGDFDIDDDFTWALQARLDVPFERFGATFGVLYLPTSAVPGADDDAELELDALVLTAGLSVSF
jgi:hypothetical protein